MREFVIKIDELPSSHTVVHLCGIIRQSLANLGIDAEVWGYEVFYEEEESSQ